MANRVLVPLSSACVTNGLAQKIDVYRRGGISVCFGGTRPEVALRQNRLDGYLDAARRYGIGCRTWVRTVSSSSGRLAIPSKRNKLREAAAELLDPASCRKGRDPT
jgi:phosphosulfolactate synthase (CoM biosynthesis protein A)